ncbi:glycosyltransferase family 4 protein [Consotaella salsifontis]|nr:glycosyltransferase family 4 protein [Consotaella salsifontis]
MTADAVGGVWQYCLDAARALSASGVEIVLAVLGPAPDAAQRAEAMALRNLSLVHLDAPLDWLVEDEAELDPLARQLDGLAGRTGVDLIHLNAPSQVVGLGQSRPVVAVSHSCVITWWRAMRDGPWPAEWDWKHRRNRAGFNAADVVLAPSRSHAEALKAAYGEIAGLRVVHNAVRPAPESSSGKEPFAFAAGRWWDESKNGHSLDAAAADCAWPVVMAGNTEGPNGQALDLRHAEAPGVLSSDAVREMMARAAIFVSPSLYEPFGLALLEAAHAKCALVVSDIAIFREVWADAALFVDARDAGAMAKALNRLIADPGERQRLGEKAAERAAAFSLERQCRGLLDAYRAATQRHEQRARPAVALVE